jgi:hypothetical protein
MGVLTSCDESPVALTPSDLGLPPDVLDHLGRFFPSQLPMSTALGGRTIRPGPCDEDASGVGVASLGDRSLAALCARSIFRGAQAHQLHACSGALTTCQGAHCRHQGDGSSPLHPTPGLQGLDHRGQTPGFAVLLACVLQTLEAFAVFAHGSDIGLKNAVLRWCGTPHLREPSQVGRAPRGPAHLTAIVSEHKGVEAPLGVLQIADGVFTRAGESTHGVIVDLGARDRGEGPRAGQASQWYGVSAVGFDAIARCVGHQGGGHAPAVVPFFHQIPREPGATGTSFRDEEQMWGFRWHCADELIEVTLPCANAAEGGDRGTMILGHRGNRNRVFVDVHADEACVRRGPG